MYDQFTSDLDNLIILENFLRKTYGLLTNAFLKSKTNQAQGFDQEKMVTNLIKQVKPRERKLLFPELGGDSQLSVVNKRSQKQDEKQNVKIAQSKLLNQGPKGSSEGITGSSMTAGEKQSIASFRDFTEGMLKQMHQKMRDHLTGVYGS